MGIIQCAEKCGHQLDGYCQLEKCTTINSPSGPCPYFLPLSLDKFKGISQTTTTNNFD